MLIWDLRARPRFYKRNVNTAPGGLANHQRKTTSACSSRYGCTACASSAAWVSPEATIVVRHCLTQERARSNVAIISPALLLCECGSIETSRKSPML